MKPTVSQGRAELGAALGRRAEDCAQRAQQRLREFPWVGPEASDAYLRTRMETMWFGTMLVARWLASGLDPSEEELSQISGRGRRAAGEGLSIVNVTRGYLVWRDAVLEVLNEEARRLGTESRVLGLAEAAVRATCDGNLMRMARAFDEHLRDVSARLDEERENLRHVALHDQLTGLPNRLLLYDRLAHAVAGARRTRRALAVLLVDLDGFKEVNDSFGHRQGDLVLAQVAQRLQRALRAADTVARLGGDEFVAVLPRARRAVALAVAERILRELASPLAVEGTVLSLRASIGVAFFAADGEDADALMLSADRAMYVAKRSGGGIHAGALPPRARRVTVPSNL
jgi:diguanylate cyclase (GGDEF)-like protein